MKISERAFPQVKFVMETPGKTFKNIVFPLTDGRKEMEMVVSLEEAYKSEGKALTKAYERNITLALIDDEWKEHLREMDDLRTSVQQAVYEQKDPLIVYKLDSFELFKSMLGRLNLETVETLVKMNIPALEEEIKSTNKEVTTQNSYDQAQLGRSTSTSTQSNSGAEGYQEAIQSSMPEQPKQKPVIAEPKINRNDACPCGSGKKYKQCHGK